MKLIMKKLYYIILIATIVVACNSKKQNTEENLSQQGSAAEDVYTEFIEKHLPVDREYGACNVGNTRGDAYFNLGKENLSVSVNYRVITSFSQYTGEFEYSRWVKESGKLNNITLTNDDKNVGYYEISGDWDNQDAGDGRFTIKLFEENKKNTVLIQISGSGWSYFENIEFDDKKFNEIKTLLRNPNIKNIPKSPSTIEPIATEEIPSTSEEAVSKTILDLCNYGEFVSSTNGVAETMEFNKDENGQLIIDYITTRGKQKLGYRENFVYFLTNPDKMYEIINIRDDNTSFQLVNPDGTIQNYNAIEH
jgi:hypothetical protein